MRADSPRKNERAGEGAWEGVKQQEDGELKFSSKRRRTDRRRRKFQTPAAEALSALFGWRWGGVGTPRGEVTDYRAQCWAEPDHS